MDLLKILFLSVLQGVTEFLPVSSSGHLVLAGHFVNVDEPGVLLEVVLHTGTLISILVYFHKDLWSLVRRGLAFEADAWKFAGLLVLASLPAIAVYMGIGDLIEEQFAQPLVASAMLCVTGLLLIAVHYVPEGRADIGWWRSLLIGVAQAFAMLPGISRAGSTISVAKFSGVGSKDAAHFSFMMAIPILAGGALLQLLKVFNGDYAGQVNFAHLGAGFAMSALSGVLAIGILMRLLVKKRFWLFGIYCLLAGLISAAVILL